MVSNEEVGLTNFEKIIQISFDSVETQITKLHSEINELVEKEKQAYVEGSVKEICNDFACKLSISDREEILSLP